MSNQHVGFVSSDHSDVAALASQMGAFIRCQQVAAPVGKVKKTKQLFKKTKKSS